MNPEMNQLIGRSPMTVSLGQAAKRSDLSPQVSDTAPTRLKNLLITQWPKGGLNKSRYRHVRVKQNSELPNITPNRSRAVRSVPGCVQVNTLYTSNNA